MELENLLKWRRSYRKFDEERLVSKDDINFILSSIKYSSSANNRQNLRFISVEDKKVVLEVFEHTKWASYLPDNLGKPKQGERPVYFIAILSNKEKNFKFDGVDLGIVVSNLTLAAAEKGIGSCIIGSINERKIKDVLSYDDNYVCNLVIAFGYPIIDSKIKEVKFGSDISYYPDENGNYVVPKYKLNEILKRI